MRDLVYLLLTAGFFVLAYAYVAGCSRVLGPAPTAEHPSPGHDPGGSLDQP